MFTLNEQRLNLCSFMNEQLCHACICTGPVSSVAVGFSRFSCN